VTTVVAAAAAITRATGITTDNSGIFLPGMASLCLTGLGRMPSLLFIAPYSVSQPAPRISIRVPFTS
jgi:hypothetical protein